MNSIIWATTAFTAFAETGETRETLGGGTTEQVSAFQIGKRPGTFLSVGALGGVGFVEPDEQDGRATGGYGGLEATAARVNGSRSFGLTSDVVLDSAQGVVLTVGPKVGVWALHVDGGLSVRVPLSDPTTQSQERVQSRYGLYTKGSVNLGLGTFYYRTLWGNESLRTVHQVGLSVRVPWLLGYQPRTGSN